MRQILTLLFGVALGCVGVVGALAISTWWLHRDTGWYDTGYGYYPDPNDPRAVQLRLEFVFDKLIKKAPTDLYKLKVRDDVCLDKEMLECHDLPSAKVKLLIEMALDQLQKAETAQLARQNNEIAQRGSLVAIGSLIVSAFAFIVSLFTFLYRKSA